MRSLVCTAVLVFALACGQIASAAPSRHRLALDVYDPSSYGRSIAPLVKSHRINRYAHRRTGVGVGSGTGSGSGSGSSTSAPTAAPTTAAPAVSVQRVTQSAVISNIAVADYTGNLKSAYEFGFAIPLGLCVNGSNTYREGVTMASTAASARRSISVTFTADVAQSLIDAGTVSQTTLEAGVTTSSLASGVSTAISQDSALAAVTQPTVVSVGSATVVAVTVAPTASTSSGSDDDDTGLIVGVTIGAVVFVGVVAAIIAVVVMNSGGEAAGGTSMAMTAGQTAEPGIRPSDQMLAGASKAPV